MRTRGAVSLSRELTQQYLQAVVFILLVKINLCEVGGHNAI